MLRDARVTPLLVVEFVPRVRVCQAFVARICVGVWRLYQEFTFLRFVAHLTSSNVLLFAASLAIHVLAFSFLDCSSVGRIAAFGSPKDLGSCLCFVWPFL